MSVDPNLINAGGQLVTEVVQSELAGKPPKQYLTSKTIILNGSIVISGLLLMGLSYFGVVNEQILTLAGVGTVSGVVNFVLRLYTGTPIAGSPADVSTPVATS